MIFKSVLLLLVLVTAQPDLLGQASEKVHYFDEMTMRYLTLEKADFGNTSITVRFAGDPGSAAI